MRVRRRAFWGVILSAHKKENNNISLALSLFIQFNCYTVYSNSQMTPIACDCKVGWTCHGNFRGANVNDCSNNQSALFGLTIYFLFLCAVFFLFSITKLVQCYRAAPRMQELLKSPPFLPALHVLVCSLGWGITCFVFIMFGACVGTNWSINVMRVMCML